MEFSVTSKIEDGKIICQIDAPEANAYTRYAYYLYESSGTVLEKQGYIKDSSFTFCPNKPGAYYVKGFVQHKAATEAEQKRESKKSNTVLFDNTNSHESTDIVTASRIRPSYPVKTLTYDDIILETFRPSEPTIYEILWNGVKFEFLIYYNPNSDQAVVFGTGDVVGAPSLPIFSRAKWIEDLSSSGIWYFDPTVYLGKTTLGWCYGTNDRWYLEDIAILIAEILKKMEVTVDNTLFYGSSAGGYTAAALATIFRGKATVINPQWIVPNFWPGLFTAVKDSVLRPNETLIQERLHAVDIFKRENHVPSIHLLQNIWAEHDLTSQISPFLNELAQSKLDCENRIQINFYCAEKGHSGMPCKESCLTTIRADLNLPLPPSAGNSPIFSRLENTQKKPPASAFPSPHLYFQDSDTPNIAREILNGELTVFRRIEKMPYTLEKFDWNVRFSRIADTFQLYLQAMNPISILTRAYELEQDPIFLDYAYKILCSWQAFAFVPSRHAGNKYVWNDHAVALRAENILYFWQVANFDYMSERDRMLRDLLKKHGEWLCDDKNYAFKHNHGIMQDRALISLGIIFEEPQWVEHAKERLLEQQKIAFNSEMIHTENSPGYAILVSEMLRGIGVLLEKNGDPLGKALQENMKKTKAFINWATKPNGIIAQIGDTSNPTGEQRGSKSAIKRKIPETHIVYPQMGYYFYRSKQDKDESLDTWKMLKSGFVKQTHKHCDDCSFMLYSKGYEIFADCGIGGYTGNKFRDFFTSALAHNTVIVDNNSYSCKNAENAVGFSGHHFYPDYDYVCAFNNAYEDVSFSRKLYSNGDLTVLVDDLNSSQQHVYSQLFHLAEGIRVRSANAHETILEIADSGYICRIQQFGVPVQVSVVQGDIETAGLGLISRSPNHWTATQTLKYDITAQQGRFITVITIETDSGVVRLENGDFVTGFADYNREHDIISVGSISIPLSLGASISHADITSTSPNPVKVIFTIDTEHAHGGEPIRISGDLRKFGIEENFGISAIMDIFEEFGMKAVFFVNVYEADNYDPEYANYMEEILTEIHSRGHEVALHCHQKKSPLFPHNNTALSNMSEEQQIANISDGLDFVERVINYRPISFRGGAFRMNAETIRALGKAGIRYDSTCNYLENRNVIGHWKTINQVFAQDGVVEIPVMHFINSEGKYSRLDLENITSQEFIEILEDMQQQEFPFAQIMFHSFSFMRRRAENENEIPLVQIGDIKDNRSIFGGNPAMKERLRDILAFLKESSRHKVVTFDQLQDDMLIPLPETDHIFAAHTDVAKNAQNRFSSSNYYDSSVGHVVSFQELARFPHYEIKNGKLHFYLEISNKIPVNIQFAFYLMSDTEAIQKIGYSTSTECEFEIPTDGVYYVKSFLINGVSSKNFLTKHFTIQNGVIVQD